MLFYEIIFIFFLPNISSEASKLIRQIYKTPKSDKNIGHVERGIGIKMPRGGRSCWEDRWQPCLQALTRYPWEMQHSILGRTENLRWDEKRRVFIQVSVIEVNKESVKEEEEDRDVMQVAYRGKTWRIGGKANCF